MWEQIKLMPFQKIVSFGLICMDLYEILYLSPRSVSKRNATLVPMAVTDALVHFISLDIAFMPKDHHDFQFQIYAKKLVKNFMHLHELQSSWTKKS